MIEFREDDQNRPVERVERDDPHREDGWGDTDHERNDTGHPDQGESRTKIEVLHDTDDREEGWGSQLEHEWTQAARAHVEVYRAGPFERPEELNKADFEAIARYTSMADHYLNLNQPLREGTIAEIEPIAADSHQLSKALKKVPETHEIVYRKIAGNLSQDTIDRYEPGTVVIENGYTSASLNLDLPWDHGNVQMIILSEHGRVMDRLSQVPIEHEVLFDRFSRFLVLDKRWDEDRRHWTIFMREV